MSWNVQTLDEGVEIITDGAEAGVDRWVWNTILLFETQWLYEQ